MPNKLEIPVTDAIKMMIENYAEREELNELSTTHLANKLLELAEEVKGHCLATPYLNMISDSINQRLAGVIITAILVGSSLGVNPLERVFEIVKESRDAAESESGEMP